MLLPSYVPGPDQLPPELRVFERTHFALHFTDPEYAATIVAENIHQPTKIGPGNYGVFLTRLGPHTHTAEGLMQELFAGDRTRSPHLWAALAYMSKPSPTGLRLIPDNTLPGDEVFYTPTNKAGIVDVASYLLAWGVAQPASSGASWFWRVP